MRSSVKLCCAVAAAALVGPVPAAAQSVDRIVAFGDSYADDGNLFQLIGSPPPAVYSNGRFSNGTNFVDTMAQLLGVPVDNFAIGGAQTGNTNIIGPGIPGFALEYNSFLAGGGPAAFPSVSGTFDENDLAVISIGGNDARAYELALGTGLTDAQIAARIAGAPAAAAVSVAQATAGLNALVGAGAQNITFLAGDVGRLPEVRGTPIAAVGTAFSTAYNNGIQTTLAGYAANGVIVNYLDLTQLGNVVEANLAAFGLQSAGACPIACVTTNPELLSQYFFYVDQLHPTSAGHAIIARYAVAQLQAPLQFEAQTDLGLTTASSFGQMMSGRMDLAGGDADNPLHFYLVGTAGSHDIGPSANSLAYEYDSVGATAGVEYDLGVGLVGVAVSYSRPEVDFLIGNGRIRSDAWQIGAYGKFGLGGAEIEAYAGYGWLDYGIRRTAVIDEIRGDTDGTGFVIGGEASYMFDMAALKVGPVVGVQYARAEIDGFTEEGDPVLTLNVSDQRASEFVGFAGAAVEFELDMGGARMQPFVKLLAEKELDSSSRDILYSQTSAPIIVNSWELEEGERDVYGRIEGGVSFGITGAISLELQASATFEHPEKDEFSGFAGVKIGF